MPMSTSGYDPFWMFREPLSGDVNQRITAPWFSPSLTVKYAGDPTVEDRVVTEIASYGKQLGWLTEIVIALANKRPPPKDTLRRLEEASDRIEAVKRKVLASDLDVAIKALDRLQRNEPEAYNQLLSDRKARERTT